MSSNGCSLPSKFLQVRLGHGGLASKSAKTCTCYYWTPAAFALSAPAVMPGLTEMATPPAPVPSSSHRYLIDDGWRYVRPYGAARVSNVRARFIAQPLLPALTEEFQGYSAAHYERCIDSGLLLLNGARTSATAILRDGDRIALLTHRHELPIRAAAVTVTASDGDADLLLVNKPASWPMHPAGAYNLNSLTSILSLEHGLEHPHTLYRLDRVVTGLLLVARTPDAARKYCTLLAADDAVKLYVARVHGRVPAGVSCIDYRIRGKPGGGRRGEFESGPHVVAPDGKAALTAVLPVAYDAVSDSSVVLLRAVTGRTHQLRCHMLAVNHPIANDPCYGGLAHHMVDDVNAVPHCWPVEHRMMTMMAATGGDEGCGAVAPEQQPPPPPPPFTEADTALAAAICPYCAQTRSLAADHAAAAAGAPLEGGSSNGVGATSFRASIWLHCLSYSVGTQQFRVEGPHWLASAPGEEWEPIPSAALERDRGDEGGALCSLVDAALAGWLAKIAAASASETPLAYDSLNLGCA